MGAVRGRFKKWGDICVHIADSLCFIAETNNNIVKQLYSNKKNEEFLLHLKKNHKLTESKES